MPGRLLRDAQELVDPLAGEALDADGHEVDREQPGAQGQAAVLHDGSLANREMRPAVAATVRHGTPVLDDRVVGGCALGAEANPVGPALAFEPGLGRGLVRELLLELKQREALQVCDRAPPGCCSCRLGACAVERFAPRRTGRSGGTSAWLDIKLGKCTVAGLERRHARLERPQSGSMAAPDRFHWAIMPAVRLA